MRTWSPVPPSPSTMGDHDVPILGTHLQGRRIALLVCGGIAAMKAPTVARSLRRHGADVVAYMSEESAKYVAEAALEWATDNRVVTRLTAASEHLNKDRPFDAYLVAPATYNTINKLRYGSADSVVSTTLASALGHLERGRAHVLLAPTMHGDMHNAVLQESLLQLQRLGVCLIPPKDAYGKHNLPGHEEIAAHVCARLSMSSLAGKRVLVTGGATPTPIDNVRAITNRFRGRLAIEIARELTLRGAEVELILGAGSAPVPSYLQPVVVRTYEEYRGKVFQTLAALEPRIGIFAAAVADYAPARVLPGKTPSDGSLRSIELVRTEKIIDTVSLRWPDLRMISFKYQEDVSRESLLEIAKERLSRGHSAVVANRGEEVGPQGEQIAYIVRNGRAPERRSTKRGIAEGVCDCAEELC